MLRVCKHAYVARTSQGSGSKSNAAMCSCCYLYVVNKGLKPLALTSTSFQIASLPISQILLEPLSRLRHRHIRIVNIRARLLHAALAQRARVKWTKADLFNKVSNLSLRRCVVPR